MHAVWIILYFFCLIKKIDHNALEKHALDAIRSAFVVVLILLSVGTLIGSWIISGTVPTIICYGLELINPRYFLPVTVLICSIMSAKCTKQKPSSLPQVRFPQCRRFPEQRTIKNCWIRPRFWN